MINNATKKKIMLNFIEQQQKDRIEELDELIKSLNEWFENEGLPKIFNSTEEKIIKEWEKSNYKFPVLSGSNVVDIRYSSDKLNIIPSFKREFSDVIDWFMVDSTGESCQHFTIKLSKLVPDLVEDADELENPFQVRLRHNAPELYESLFIRVKYIYELFTAINNERSSLRKLMSRKDLTFDKIKKYSPNLYKLII